MNDSTIINDAITGTAEAGLTIEYAWNTGKAIADWLPTTGNVVVVYAATQSQLASAVVEGLRLQGRAVIDGGTGDADAVAAYIKTSGLSGGVLIGFDQTNNRPTIEVYLDDTRRVEYDTGLQEICQLVEAGNFVPAAVKGELTAIA